MKYIKIKIVFACIIVFGLFTSGKQPPLNIGDSYEGGTIFYLDQSKLHGYLVDNLELQNTTPWSNEDIVYCQATNLKDGEENTKKIVAKVGKPTDMVNQYAAYICSQIDRGGYKNWYLPSNSEFKLLYDNRLLLNLNIKLSSIYWSSLEQDDFNANAYDFDHNIFTSIEKASQFKVRAIRKF